MWAIIKSFFAANTAKVIEWVAIVGSAAGAVLAIFNAGKKSEKATELQGELKQVEQAHEVEDTNRAQLHDGDAVKRLSSDWDR